MYKIVKKRDLNPTVSLIEVEGAHGGAPRKGRAICYYYPG